MSRHPDETHGDLSIRWRNGCLDDVARCDVTRVTALEPNRNLFVLVDLLKVAFRRGVESSLLLRAPLIIGRVQFGRRAGSRTERPIRPAGEAEIDNLQFAADFECGGVPLALRIRRLSPTDSPPAAASRGLCREKGTRRSARE